MISRIIIDVLIALSLFFAFAGTIGMLRMPDAFCRMQSSTNIGTLGTLFVCIAGVIYSIIYLGDAQMAVKMGVLGVFYIVTNPIAGHAIAKAAYKKGLAKEANLCCDKYGEDLEDAD